MGISFYTFQTMSYTIDVYKGNCKVQKNFVALGTYVALFPQLIAGPIVRYSDIEKEIERLKNTQLGANKEVQAFLEAHGSSTLKNAFGNLSAGIVLEKKVGEYVNEGDILAYMHLNKEEKFEQAKERFVNAYSIVDDKVEPKKLIYGVVTKDEVKKF